MVHAYAAKKLNANQPSLTIVGSQWAEVAAARAYTAIKGSHPSASHRASLRARRARVTNQATRQASSAKLANRTFMERTWTVNTWSAELRKITTAQVAVATAELGLRSSVMADLTQRGTAPGRQDAA